MDFVSQFLKNKVLLLVFILAAVACKKTEDNSVTDGTDQNYSSITDLTVSAQGSSLVTSPVVTWQLGFPVFTTLEAGLATASTGEPSVVAWTDIGVVTSHQFTGLSLSQCTDYYPMVRAKNASGTVLDSYATATPFRVDTTAPTAPSGLSIATDSTDSKTGTATWTASTDNCGLDGYELAVGTTSGGTETLNWSPVATTSHQATSGVSLTYGVPYYTSVRSKDTADQASTVTTSSSWRLRSPSALLSGTQTTSSNDFYAAANSYMRWSSSAVNSEFFSHSTITDPDVLTVKRSGDYIMYLSMPLTIQSGCTTRCSIKARVLVNGVEKTDALVHSSYLISASGFSDSSNNLVVYLQSLSANDEVQVYIERVLATTSSVISEGVQAYVEYIYSGRDFFYATANATTNSSNYNQVTAYPLSWTQQKTSSAFTWSGGTPQNITLSAGNYMISVNLPMEARGTCTTRQNVKLNIRLDGVLVSGGQGAQGMIDCSTGHVTSTVHWTGVLQSVTANQVLTVEVLREASTNTVDAETGRLASIIVEKLKSVENYISLTGTRTVGSTNWNLAASPIQWSSQLAVDATHYTHSTVTNSHQITVTQNGNYLLTFNDHLTGVITRGNVVVRVQKNGSNVSGAICASNQISNSNGHNESSCSLNFLLSGVVAGDVISLTATQDAAAGTITASSPAKLTLLRVK